MGRALKSPSAQFAFSVMVGVTAAYVYNLARVKGWLPGMPKNVA